MSSHWEQHQSRHKDPVQTENESFSTSYVCRPCYVFYPYQPSILPCWPQILTVFFMCLIISSHAGYSATLKMDAAVSLETSVPIYQTTRRHNPWCSNVRTLRFGNTICHSSGFVLHERKHVYKLGLQFINMFINWVSNPMGDNVKYTRCFRSPPPPRTVGPQCSSTDYDSHKTVLSLRTLNTRFESWPIMVYSSREFPSRDTHKTSYDNKLRGANALTA
jgi:hypothetical protein